MKESPIASMMRGFLVYIAAIGGIYITTQDPFDAPTPAQYVRVVGALSVAGFALGFDPTRVSSLLANVPRAVKGREEPSAGDGEIATPRPSRTGNPATATAEHDRRTER